MSLNPLFLRRSSRVTRQTDAFLDPFLELLDALGRQTKDGNLPQAAEHHIPQAERSMAQAAETCPPSYGLLRGRRWHRSWQRENLWRVIEQVATRVLEQAEFEYQRGPREAPAPRRCRRRRF